MGIQRANTNHHQFYRLPADPAHIAAALLLGAGVGIYLWLDVATHSMFYALPITLGFALYFALSAVLLLWRAPLRHKVVLIGSFLVLIFAIRSIEWNSRKPFLRDLGAIQTGMTEVQVNSIMRSYMRSPNAGFSESSTILYRHTDEGWGNRDVGIVTFKDGRVVQVKFFPD